MCVKCCCVTSISNESFDYALGTTFKFGSSVSFLPAVDLVHNDNNTIVVSHHVRRNTLDGCRSSWGPKGGRLPPSLAQKVTHHLYLTHKHSIMGTSRNMFLDTVANEHFALLIVVQSFLPYLNSLVWIRAICAMPLIYKQLLSASAVQQLCAIFQHPSVPVALHHMSMRWRMFVSLNWSTEGVPILSIVIHFAVLRKSLIQDCQSAPIQPDGRAAPSNLFWSILHRRRHGTPCTYLLAMFEFGPCRIKSAPATCTADRDISLECMMSYLAPNLALEFISIAPGGIEGTYATFRDYANGSYRRTGPTAGNYRL